MKSLLVGTLSLALAFPAFSSDYQIGNRRVIVERQNGCRDIKIELMKRVGKEWKPDYTLMHIDECGKRFEYALRKPTVEEEERKALNEKVDPPIYCIYGAAQQPWSRPCTDAEIEKAKELVHDMWILQ